MSADARSDDFIPALPPGTRFGELEILGTLGVGGFGIVYLARDHSLEREIAIKEYMPSQFASRDGQSFVCVRSVSMKETFELGRRSFVNEARLLARFDHPSLLKVYRFWEANGTAYMAMPRLVGQNLREARRTRATPPPEAWARRIFDAVLGGLEVLHAQQVWHRDVAPDNIFMPADGSAPILLDFGAARQTIGDRTQVFTAILKPSFAPIEQYAEADTLRQGPWTDFYALAAAMHELLTGRPPPPATTRAMTDDFAPLAVEGYSPQFLAGLDWALRMPPHQRPQTAAAWREVMDGRVPVPEPLPAPPRTGVTQPPPRTAALDLDIADSDPAEAPPQSSLAPTIVVPRSGVFGPATAPGDADATIVSPRSAAAPLLPDLPPALQPAPAPASAAPAAAGKRRWGLLAAGGAALLLLGLFIVQLRGRPAAPEAAPAELAASVPAPAVTVAEASSAPTPVAAMPDTVAPAPVKTAPVASAASLPLRTGPAASQPAPAVARRDGALKPVAGDKPAEVRAMPRTSPVATPEPTGSMSAGGNAASRSSAGAAAAPAPAGEPRTAAEACGGRVFLARAWCIDRQCEKPAFQNDAECVKLREIRSNNRTSP